MVENLTWDQVPSTLAAYNNEEYADNSGGTSASFKLIRYYTDGKSDNYEDIPVHRRTEFLVQLEYRYNACVNLRQSKAARPKR